jgi:hypothetical protein
MSLTNAGRLSDADIQALIAYIRGVPRLDAREQAGTQHDEAERIQPVQIRKPRWDAAR